jgi:hypothetical protein
MSSKLNITTTTTSGDALSKTISNLKMIKSQKKSSKQL